MGKIKSNCHFIRALLWRKIFFVTDGTTFPGTKQDMVAMVVCACSTRARVLNRTLSLSK